MATTPTFKDTLARVKARLAELRKHGGERRTSAPAEASTTTWPHDLNADGEVVTSGWGTDPVEGA